jgi:ribose 5-phosphate isomerase A
MSGSDREKELAAKRAVDFVQDSMVVGLGTGSTSAFAIIELGNRMRTGLRVTAASSSKASEDLARSVGIPIVDFTTLSRLDLTIDGADEIDANFHAVKGGGGALLREKVIAAASDQMIAIVDSSKVVSKIGKCKVPVEVLPFAMEWVERSVTTLGATVTRRKTSVAGLFRTDQNNFILDLVFREGYDAPQLAAALDSIPGLFEHGLFLQEIDVLVIGRGETVETRKRSGK